MSLTTHQSYCRVCHAYCALEVDVEDGRVAAVRGDRNDPVYGGYTCIKGRQLPEMMEHPARLRSSLRRRPDGSFEEISTEQALDEIADRVGRIIEEKGSRAVATYCGTHAFQNSVALAVAQSWHRGIGSPSFYSSITIDQPGKFIALSRAGFWSAGNHGFEGSDVVMIIGCNTLVSQYAPNGGIPAFNPAKRLRDAQKAGMKVICIDPRRTEVARRSDLHLAVRPGEDPALLAGILRVILQEGWFDEPFCEAVVDGVEELRHAVEPFTLEVASERTGIPSEQILEAARLFGQGPRGIASTGTGPDMSPRANLTEHLVIALNVICGRTNREGDRVPNPGILSPPIPRRAQVMGPRPAYGHGPKSRVRGLGQVIGEMPTAALSDEMLEPGEGQVRALLCIGGNPVVAFPDQQKTLRALEGLELLVCVDAYLSATAKMADYILAPKLCLERSDVTWLTDSWYETPYAHYTKPAVEAQGDEIEEWELYTGLARRLSGAIELQGGVLPLDPPPTKEDVLALTTAGARVPFDEVRQHQGGHVYEDVEVRVEPAKPGAEGRFQLAPPGVLEELDDVIAEPLEDGFSHRLISRRLKHVYNSSGRHLDSVRQKGTTNPAFMNPADLLALGMANGEIVEIRSAHGAILGVIEAAADVPSGVVSMAHAWGDPSLDPKEVREVGSSTNALVSNETDFDPISGMARQSAIPVNVLPAPELMARS